MEIKEKEVMSRCDFRAPAEDKDFVLKVAKAKKVTFSDVMRHAIMLLRIEQSKQK